MLYLAIGFIIATTLFVVMRMTLRHKQLSLQQFFVLYILAVTGLVLVFLGITGRLHWLFVIIGSVLPFFAGFVRWAVRLWRAAGIVNTIRQVIGQLTGLDGSKNHSTGSGPMSYQQALDVLGLEGNPTEEEIKTAHRNLIQKVHPDRGGSTLLAKQINEAKDVLLKHVG